MREDYGKFPDLVRLIRFLATSVRGVTYDEIMQQFEWSRKTTERNLKFIILIEVNLLQLQKTQYILVIFSVLKNGEK